jgi:hypothetical protein
MFFFADDSPSLLVVIAELDPFYTSDNDEEVKHENTVLNVRLLVCLSVCPSVCPPYFQADIRQSSLLNVLNIPISSDLFVEFFAYILLEQSACIHQ